MIRRSFSLHFHYILCILRHFPSAIASLLIAFPQGISRSFSPGGFNYINQSTGERSHSTHQVSYLHLNCLSDSSVGTACHSSFQVSSSSLPWKGTRCLLSILFCQRVSLKYLFFCPRVIMATTASS